MAKDGRNLPCLIKIRGEFVYIVVIDERVRRSLAAHEEDRIVVVDLNLADGFGVFDQRQIPAFS